MAVSPAQYEELHSSSAEGQLITWDAALQMVVGDVQELEVGPLACSGPRFGHGAIEVVVLQGQAFHLTPARV